MGYKICLKFEHSREVTKNVCEAVPWEKPSKAHETFWTEADHLGNLLTIQT